MHCRQKIDYVLIECNESRSSPKCIVISIHKNKRLIVNLAIVEQGALLSMMAYGKLTVGRLLTDSKR